MRPVSNAFPINQPFGSMRTQGVAPSWTPDTVGWYVRLYGNYQPFGHAGCDFQCPEGTPVHAIAAGTVLWADWGYNLPGTGDVRKWLFYKDFPGILTVIQHDGWISAYAHLSAAHMNVGDRVAEGQQIALSGSTGGVAPHLHVESLVDMNYSTGGGLIYGRTNPEPYFGSAAIAPQGATTQEETMAIASQEWLDSMIAAQGRMDQRSLEIYNRVFGREVQRWYHPVTGEVRTEAFEGAVSARSSDVHDVLTTNALVTTQTNKILDAVAAIPGVDASVIAGLRDELAAELKEATADLSVTLTVAPSTAPVLKPAE